MGRMQMSKQTLLRGQEFSWICQGALLWTCCLWVLFLGGSVQAQFRAVERADRIDVMRGESLVTSYLFRSGTKPVLWPIHGPDGHKMTRSYPMDTNVPGEDKDHPHHRGLWITYGEVNDSDWWAEGKDKGSVEHKRVVSVASGDAAEWVAEHVWTKGDKKVLLETAHYRVHGSEDETILDCEFLWRGADPQAKVHFGDTKEGMFAIRVPETMRGDKPGGEILNSAGDKQGDAWGEPATWVDYSGPVQSSGDKSSIYGIAILVHPKSFHAEGLWHVRTYGLFAHNAFGIKDFLEKRTATESAKPAPFSSGGYELEPGKSLHFVYRVVLHRGRWDLATGDAHWTDFSKVAPKLKAD